MIIKEIGITALYDKNHEITGFVVLDEEKTRRPVIYMAKIASIENINTLLRNFCSGEVDSEGIIPLLKRSGGPKFNEPTKAKL